MNRLLRLCFLLPALLLAHRGLAQPLQISLVLNPPYSPYFSDYLTYGNKGLITIINTSGSPVDVYFKGSITGDNSIAGATKGDYKPAVPINIKTGASQLRGNDFEEYFSLSHFAVTGISTQQLTTGAGLPEGHYTVCIQAFDFTTGAPASNNACFNITILYPEPPILQLPLCDNSTVMPNPAQSIPFNWTIPPGSPAGTRFVMKMVELLPGQNPNDAINTLTTPPFFEKDVAINTYVYALSDPKLTVGKKYAWQVQAYDPNKQVTFRNNGNSPVCTFTYGSLIPSLANTDSLVFISPLCHTPSAADQYLDSNAKAMIAALNGKLVYSSDQGITINWRWGSQVDSATLVNGVKTANGGNVLLYSVSINPLQLMGNNRAPVPGNTDNFYSTTIIAPKQRIDLTPSAIQSAGLKPDHWYTVSVSATGNKNGSGATLSAIKSCDVHLIKMADTAKKVRITGQLAYRLEDGGAPHGANKVSISLNLSNVKQHTNTAATKPAGVTVVDTMTDELGNFSVDLPVTKAMENSKYLDITVNNKYYQQPDTAYAINLKSYDSSTTMVGGQAVGSLVEKGLKTSLSIGQKLLNAYTYSLTVKMTKGFPKYGFDTTKFSYAAVDNTYDSLTINPNIKVKAGIPVVLYRKMKVVPAPRFEGDTSVPAQPISQPYTRLIVGRGVTGYRTVNGVEQTVVIFNRLLCSQSNNDVYYIKADLPAKSNGTSRGTASMNVTGIGAVNMPDWQNDYNSPPPGSFAMEGRDATDDDGDFLAAPEQLVSYDIKKMQKGQIHDTMSVVYSLISSKPPMSRLKGQLVYSWPSSPGVKRPLPHTKFSITSQYIFNNGANGWLMATDECQAVAQRLYLNPGPQGQSGPVISPNSGGIVLGTGETDDQGFFDIMVLNYDKKGRISDSAQFEGITLTYCDKVKDQNHGVQTDPRLTSPQDRGDWVKNNYTEGMLGDIFTMGVNSQYVTGAGNSFTNTGGFTAGVTNATMTHSNGLTVVGATNGGLLNFTNGAAFNGPSVTMPSFTKDISGKGPAFTDEASPEPDASGTSVPGMINVKVDRVLGITIYSPWYRQSDTTFVVDAFKTLDVGKIGVTVIERRDTLALTTTPAGLVNTVSNARIVVYRNDGTKPNALPLGEGTAKHPEKELISESMVTQSVPGTKEWILEGGLASAGNVVPYTNRALLGLSQAKYNVQIAPDPTAEGTRFLPAYFSSLPAKATLTLLKGKIVGRVVENTQKAPGMKGAKVTITDNATAQSITLYPDTSGYFEYEDNALVNTKQLHWKADGTSQLTVVTTAPGYKKDILNPVYGPKFGLQRQVQVKLDPGAYIVMRTVGNLYAQVNAYVLRGTDSNAYIADYDNGKKYRIPAPSFSDVKLTVMPEDPGYFDTTFTVSTKAGDQQLGDLKLIRRSHRMRFHIRRLNTNGTVIPAGQDADDAFHISINNGDHDGNIFVTTPCYFTFENVSVNNYAIVVSDNYKRGYIPVSFNLSNKESRDFIDYTITVRKGGTISGIVKLDGTPVKGAKLYVEYGGNTNVGDTVGFSAMTATSGDGGVYAISGIPLGVDNVTVHATMSSPGTTIIGAKATGGLGSTTLTLNLNMTTAPDVTLNDVWGYPLTLENLVQKGDDYTVTGLLKVALPVGKFKSLSGVGNMRFKDVHFKKEYNVPKARLIPKTETVVMVDAAVKMRYGNRYNVALGSAESGLMAVKIPGGATTYLPVTRPFTIQKAADGTGIINAKGHIVDNSYNYPSTYLTFDGTGDFWLGYEENGAVSNVIPALPANKQNPWQPRLTSKTGDSLVYTFIGFKAKADPKLSYIDAQGRIHLNTTFRGHVPGSDSVSVNVPDLILDNNTIDPYSSQQPLIMKLDSWTVQVNNWSVDPYKGGVYSSDAVIHTGVVDLKMGLFNLRKNLFVMDKFDADHISLGAVSLENITPNSAVVYDQKVGSDGKAHWRYNLVAVGSAPAATFYLDAAKTQRMDIDYMQLISYNNENLITLRKRTDPLHPMGNSRINFYPQTMSSEGNLLFLDGPGHFDVPRTPDVNLRFNYTKVNNDLVESAEPMSSFSFNGKGNVVFKASTAKPVKGNKLLTYTGTVVEPGKFDPIDCEFSFGDNDHGTIKLLQAKQMTLVGGTKLNLGTQYEGTTLRNGMIVENQDWTTLRFSGELVDGAAVLEPGNKLNFEVLGEITANTSAIKASDIKTPFGDLNMVYDFGKKMMNGSMHMNNTEFGSYKFTGDVEVAFGAQGFLTMAAGQLNTGVLLAEGFGTFSSGLVLGSMHLEPDVIHKVTQFSKDPRSNCWLDAHNTGTFKGFFFTGGYDILNTEKSFDIGIASAYFRAVLGIEASLGAYVGGPAEFKLGLGAHGNVEAGLSAITGTSITGALTAHVNADATYVPSESHCNITGFADLTFGFTVKQSLLITTLKFDFTKTCGANFYIDNTQSPKANYSFFLSGVNENAACPSLKTPH